jgi:hypothetical protein
MPFAEDLDIIDQSIRRLHVEWEKFFGGLERRAPSELKNRVEALLRLHANSEIRNNADRFRYQGLAAKYATFSELWSKRLRAKEEGRVFGTHGLKAGLPPAPPAPATGAPAPEAPTAVRAREPDAEVRIKNPEADNASVLSLYQRFLAERQRSGETAHVKFESFQKLIGQQTTRLLAEKGGQAVAFRLETKDGRVSLRAKVVK